MDKTTYTEIPDTSDSNYWIVTQHEQNRSTTFVPRDKELHLKLKKKAWAVIQASLTKRNRKGAKN
ncbi:hypothetical protein [Spirosoma endophyticum]|uniref:Uncharacterized protein n=1 Tax=Spirosoma endophyticum TaxID=662367 RepID=A0A1I2HM24_9BACT|nr:hypothetical protein [Spirosoma endophyticum]SFF29816.1 hypothetical protein SAMN05216167_14418 [Spirosoma endophyticum]